MDERFVFNLYLTLLFTLTAIVEVERIIFNIKMFPAEYSKPVGVIAIQVLPITDTYAGIIENEESLY